MQRMKRWCAVLAAGIVLLAVVGVARAVHAADLAWPGSELSRHAQAWFAMLTADEAAQAAYTRPATSSTSSETPVTGDVACTAAV